MSNRMSQLFNASALRTGSIYLVLVIAALVGTVINPSFASLTNLRSQLILGAPVGIVALGQTVLILTGQIDLSVPWTLTFSAVIMASLYGLGFGQLISVAAALGVGLLVGAANALGVSVFRVQALVWTLAVDMLLQGIALVYTNAQPPKAGIPQFARDMAIGSIGGIPLAFLLWLSLSIAAIVVLRCTTLGRRIYATGTNPTASFFSGIDIRRVYAVGFITSGLCASIAGILLVGYTSESYLGMGNAFLLLPIAAVVIGGTSILGGSGGYIGTVAGVLVLLVLEAILSVAQISEAGRDVIFGALIIVMVILYGRQERFIA
jgi:ribose transport system permease protein